MNEINTGGPAFPMSGFDMRHGQPVQAVYQHGMTLRDYFATHASEEDIIEHTPKGCKEEYIHDNGDGSKSIRYRQAMWTREEARYRYADAMLKARES